MDAFSTARKIAAQTPSTRNRYVDFLRAISICVVVLGHWLVSMPAFHGGELRAGELLFTVPWTQWLTWIFQVMPVFFVVGGYSNAVSWKSARRKGLNYGLWAATRLRRLIGPLVPLLIFWAFIAVIARQLDVEPSLIRSASKAALVPVWFLAVYILVTIVTPLTQWLYRRLGITSFVMFAVVAAAVDLIAFGLDLPSLRWANYGFVWLAVHQLGFVWQGGRLAGVWHGLSWALGGLGVLVLLVTEGSYPLSMLTVPGEVVSNSRPPTVALLALGVFHLGLLLSLEALARRWLERMGPWTLTVLINSRIMTLYLWHLTVMVVLVGVALHYGGIGLDTEPGSALWWLTRLPWIGVLFAVLLVFITLVGRYEQPLARNVPTSLRTWRVVSGSVLLTIGLALMATGGISDDGPVGLRTAVVLPTLAAMIILLPTLFGRRGG